MKTIEKLLRTYEKAVRDHARGSADKAEEARLYDAKFFAKRALREAMGLPRQHPVHAYRVKAGGK